MANRVVVWAVVDESGKAINATSTEPDEIRRLIVEQHGCRVVRCVESSGASPDREALAEMAFDAQWGEDAAGIPHDSWEEASEDVRDGYRRIADLLSLLGATPREDARAARDLDIYRRTLVDLHAMCGKTGPPNTHGLDATEPAKEPDGERLAWVLATPLDDEPTLVRWNAYEHRRGVFVRWATPEETPGQSGTGASPESAGDMSGRSEGSQAKNDARSVSSPAAAPPVMDEPTMPIMGTDRRVPFSDLSEFAAQRIHGQSLARLAERGGVSVRELELIRSLAPMDEAARSTCKKCGHEHCLEPIESSAATPKAAREAPEPTTPIKHPPLPPGWTIEDEDPYRLTAPSGGAMFFEGWLNAHTEAWAMYGRAAWAHGDADAALRAELNRIADDDLTPEPTRVRVVALLRRIDARLGEK